MELKITKEKVLEAAEKCEGTEEVLKTLFPEAFEKPDEPPLCLIAGFDSDGFLDVRLEENFDIVITSEESNARKRIGAIYLYTWEDKIKRYNISTNEGRFIITKKTGEKSE